jgi:RimJ/RimL family protein N-acetyltransferase
MADVGYVCDPGSFRPAPTRGAVWLDVDDDFELLKRFHDRRTPREPFTRADAHRWRDGGFVDAGIVLDGLLVARAARWTYSDEAWELAGVFTLPERRGEGLARAVCSFVTQHILDEGRTATCHTDPSNIIMRSVAERLGFVRQPG